MEEIVRIRQATKIGYVECKIGGVADLCYPSSKTRRGRVTAMGDICPTLATEGIPSRIESANNYTPFTTEDGKKGLLLGSPEAISEAVTNSKYKYRIRKLTEKECWRLMNLSDSLAANDEAFERASEVNSATQLYKQAGNSIVVNVLVALFGQMFEGKEDVYKNRGEIQK